MSQPPSAVALLQALIRCPSVTPNDGGALLLLRDLLAEAGFRVEMPVFAAPGLPDITNLYARIGTDGPCLVFAGHTDVVPPGDAASWRHPPFSGEIEDGFVYGRGACDMKGGVAAAVAAAVEFIRSGGFSRGSIAFLITGDEEGPAVNGTTKLLDWAVARGERFDACVLGEPTNPERLGDMVKNGRRGSLNGSLACGGKQGHVAYPQLAANPIHPLLKAMQALIGPPLDAGTTHFAPSNLEIVSVDVGNPAFNVIPARATARFNVRFNDLWSPATLEAELRGRIAALALDPAVKLEFEPCNSLAFLTAPGEFTALVSAAVEAETGRQPALSTTGGTSDARFITAFCPVVEFGLVGRTIHAVDECVAVADVEALTRIYGRVLRSFLADPSHPE